jgi:hypothetical protein
MYCWDQFRSHQYTLEFTQELERRANAPQLYIHTSTKKKIIVSARQLRSLYSESRDFRGYIPYITRFSSNSYFGN